MNYILINAQTRQPVPLPYETAALNGEPVTVTQFHDNGFVSVKRETAAGIRRYQAPAALFNLCLITEEDFMKEQSR